MTLLLYHCPTAPTKRRWIAQFPRLSDNLYLTIRGSTAEIAREKAELMWQFHALDPKEQAGFKLKERLDKINAREVSGPDDDEDELL